MASVWGGMSEMGEAREERAFFCEKGGNEISPLNFEVNEKLC